MFLTNAPFRAIYGPKGPVIVWLNLNGKQEVDELFERWKDTGAKIVEAVEDKPWNLREFRVADLDGNQLRVFYDFNWEMKRSADYRGIVAQGEEPPRSEGTRLNSSHLVISYAVFCLKKKTKTHS